MQGDAERCWRARFQSEAMNELPYSKWTDDGKERITGVSGAERVGKRFEW